MSANGFPVTMASASTIALLGFTDLGCRDSHRYKFANVSRFVNSSTRLQQVGCCVDVRSGAYLYRYVCARKVLVRLRLAIADRPNQGIKCFSLIGPVSNRRPEFFFDIGTSNPITGNHLPHPISPVI